MYAIRQYEFGGPETLQYESVPDPQPGTGEVIIKVLAAGVHAVDASIRKGEAGGPMARPQLPMTPGREAAGEVVAIGAEVDHEWLGASVVVHLGAASGGYAELATAKASSLHRIPETVTPQAAIALIGSGRTALAILDVAEVNEGDVVLVPGASGGLGNQLVQLSIAAGATVIALVGGPDKVARLSGFGATVIDYADPSWPKDLERLTAERRATVLLDGVGGEIAKTLMGALGTLGRIVPFGASSGQPMEFSTFDIMGKGLTVTSGVGPTVMSKPGYLRELELRALAAGAAGHVKPLIQIFALKEAGEAQSAIESRAVIGKVVLRP